MGRGGDSDETQVRVRTKVELRSKTNGHMAKAEEGQNEAGSDSYTVVIGQVGSYQVGAGHKKP